MFSFIKRYKQRKQEKLDKQYSAVQKTVDRLRAQLLVEKEEMLSKDCGINNIQKCTDTCIHFSEGSISPCLSFNGGPWYTKVDHKCKLWNN